MAIPEPIVRLPDIPSKKWYESKGRWYSVPDYGGYRPETFAYEQPIPPKKGLGDSSLYQRRPAGEYDYQRYFQGWPNAQSGVGGLPEGIDMKQYGWRTTWEQPFYDILKDLTGPAPFLRWYESMFSKLKQRFRGEQGEISAGLPKYLRRYAAGREKAQWAQFLEGYTEKARQEYRDITAVERQYQERRYAPRVRTVEY